MPSIARMLHPQLHMIETFSRAWVAQFFSFGFVLSLALLPVHPVNAKTPSEVFENAYRSVVVVHTFDEKGNKLSRGSGVMLPNGSIATNCHVIKAAASIRVEHMNSSYSASLRVADWTRDVCALVASGIKAPGAELGSIDDLKVGSRIYVISAPKGLSLTLSEGIVSGFREVTGGRHIQITAPISKGSSGGGLFDENGRLVGLPTFYIADGQQLNFATPVEWALILSLRHSEAPHIATLQRQADDNPSNATVWRKLGVALLNIENFAEAKVPLQKAVVLDPSNSQLLTELGYVYSMLSEYGRAIEILEVAVRRDPEQISAWYNLGKAYSHKGQREKVTAIYQRLVTLDAANAQSYFDEFVSPILH